MSGPYEVKLGAFLEPTQVVMFPTLQEAGAFFFRQMSRYAPLGLAMRHGKLVKHTDAGEIILAEFDFNRDAL